MLRTMSKKFETIAHQLVVYPKELFVEDIEALYRRLITLKIYDENLSSFVSAKGLPRSAITINLKADAGKKACLFSQERIELSWAKPSAETEKEALATLFTESLEVLGEVYKNKKPAIKRVGCITTLAIETEDEEEQVDFIRKNLLKSDFSSEPLTSYEVRLTYSEDGLTAFPNCNRVISIVAGKKEGTEQDVIAIQHDVNTHQAEDANFDINQMLTFASAAFGISGVEDITKYLWPKGLEE